MVYSVMLSGVINNSTQSALLKTTVSPCSAEYDRHVCVCVCSAKVYSVGGGLSLFCVESCVITRANTSFSDPVWKDYDIQFQYATICVYLIHFEVWVFKLLRNPRHLRKRGGFYSETTVGGSTPSASPVPGYQQIVATPQLSELFNTGSTSTYNFTSVRGTKTVTLLTPYPLYVP